VLLDRRQQRVEFERLGVVALDDWRREPLCPGRHRDDRERTVRFMRANERCEPSAVEARHVEVEEDHAGLQRVAETLDRVSAIDSLDDGAADILKAGGERMPDLGVVVDDKDASVAGHLVIICTTSPGCDHKG
jgi:hypothetical protein